MQGRLAILLLALCLPLAAIYGLYRMAVSKQPQVVYVHGSRQAELERLRRLYRQLFLVQPAHDASRRIELKAADLDRGLNLLLERRRLGHARTVLNDGELRLMLALRLPHLKRKR